MSKKPFRNASPPPSDAFTLGLAEHRNGRLAPAIASYRKALSVGPRRVEVLERLGVALCESGNLDEGEKHLLKAHELAPSNAEILFDLGVLEMLRGQLAKALQFFDKVIVLNVAHSGALHARGLVLRDLGRLGEAANSLKFACESSPRNILYIVELANVYDRSGRTDDAIETYSHALLLEPRNVVVLHALADLLMRHRRFEEAYNVLTALLAHQPTNSRAMVNQGVALYFGGQHDQAEQILQRVLKAAPKEPNGWRYLAKVQEKLGKYEEQLKSLENALAAEPGDVDLILAKAVAHNTLGRYEEACGFIDSLPEETRGLPEIRCFRGLLLPLVTQSNEEIDQLRSALSENIAELLKDNIRIEEPHKVLPSTAFALGYHGRDDREILQQVADFKLAISPSLKYVSSRLDRKPLENRKIRLGFMSANLRSHSVGRVFNRFLKEIDRTRFEVILLELPGMYMGGQELARDHADKTVYVSQELSAARSQVEDEQLDALFITDLMLDQYTDSLAYSRLAPVQFTSFGHPGTSARDSIDYWVSCDWWDPAGNERHYTEKLVRLRKPPMIFEQRKEPNERFGRDHYGLPEDAHLYVCAQTIQKYHPEFDEILLGILEKDPKALLVIKESEVQPQIEPLQKRLRRTLGVAYDRVRFLPQFKNPDEYLNLLMCADALLDPVHYSGFNTSMDAFSFGLPVVTMVGHQVRDRSTSSLYHEMGFMDLVAYTPEQYVEAAVKLANDAGFREAAVGKITARAEVLFENVAVTRELEAFIEKAVTEVIDRGTV